MWKFSGSIYNIVKRNIRTKRKRNTQSGSTWFIVNLIRIKIAFYTKCCVKFLQCRRLYGVKSHIKSIQTLQSNMFLLLHSTILEISIPVTRNNACHQRNVSYLHFHYFERFLMLLLNYIHNSELSVFLVFQSSSSRLDITYFLAINMILSIFE